MRRDDSCSREEYPPSEHMSFTSAWDRGGSVAHGLEHAEVFDRSHRM